MKLNKKQLSEILEELYAFDAGLRVQEKELIEIITKMAAAKPNIEFDEKFRLKLRDQIMKRAKPDSNPVNIINFTFMKKFTYAVSLAVIALVIIIPAYYFYSKNNGLKINFDQMAINKVGANAFGDLIATTDSSGKIASVNGGEAKSFGLGGGGAAPLAYGRGGGGGGSAVSSIMPAPEANYRYVYKGDNIPDISAQMDVLKRIKQSAISLNMGNLIKGLNFGLADLNTFSDLNMQSAVLIQQGDSGYVMNIMPEEGLISISQNWQSWPAAKCGNDTACIDREQKISQADMPSDQELFQIADDFLAEHKINKKFYEQPELAYDWRAAYQTYANKADFFFPNTLDIIYPLKVNGKEVYDEYNGQKQGLMVSVDIKNKKVSGVNNLTTQNYQSSAYDVETDRNKIISYAERGGINNLYYAQGSGAANQVEIELANPKLEYIKYYNYEAGKSEELLVPALIFPVMNPPRDQFFFRQAIVVPLAKDILAEREKQSRPLNVDIGGGTGGEAITPKPLESTIK